MYIFTIPPSPLSLASQSCVIDGLDSTTSLPRGENGNDEVDEGEEGGEEDENGSPKAVTRSTNLSSLG